mmetsp:Transcript_23389/g.55436  ORF Transcript_23389/g.55436 Transcript_23389/m.55436 type:complete len:225 (+) Transcript_23389:34-708(+)
MTMIQSFLRPYSHRAVADCFQGVTVSALSSSIVQSRSLPATSVAIASTSNVVAQQKQQSYQPFSVYQRRGYSSTTLISSSMPTTSTYSNPLDQFRDTIDRQTRMTEKVGRSWSAKELRRKSYDDLHKLWYVLYKERNMLLTEKQLSRRRQLVFPQPERLYKVQKSMGAIRQVLGERKRVKVAAHLASQQEKQEQAIMEDSMLSESDALTQDDVNDDVDGRPAGK